LFPFKSVPYRRTKRMVQAELVFALTERLIRWRLDTMFRQSLLLKTAGRKFASKVGTEGERELSALGEENQGRADHV